MSTHSHPVDDESVRVARDSVPALPEAMRLGALLGLLSDPVRLRILFALSAADELCVGDLALALDISMDQSSYALKLLRAAGVVQPRRAGRVIYYRLADDFPHTLLEHCLGQLLSITDQEALR